MLADLKINERKLAPFVAQLTNSLKRQPKLEPVLQKNRTGGRGKQKVKNRKGGGEAFFI